MNGMIDMSALTQETLDALKGAIVNKAITVANGLTGYDLAAPAKDMVPVLTPTVNTTPRVAAVRGSEAAHWKQVYAISAGHTTPFVPEKERNTEISYSSVDRLATYATWGRDDSVTMEAELGAMGFEDLRARSNFWLLNIVKLEEEDSQIGGNRTLAMGTPTTPTLSASGTGATLPAATYRVIVVAIPHVGYQHATRTAPYALAAGVAGMHSNKSAVATQAVTLGQTLFCSTPAVNNAVAYAWYIGVGAGNEKLEAITPINSLAVSADLLGTGQNASTITADKSTDSLAFDGMLTQLWTPNPVTSVIDAQIITLDTGTPGTGTQLLTDGAGGIKQIDAMLKRMWDKARVSPDKMKVNSQQAQDIYNCILKNPGAFRILAERASSNGNITAGGVIVGYVNKFVGGQVVEIEVHPTMAEGTIQFCTNRLPSWYPGNSVAGAWDMYLLRDYHEIPFPSNKRAWEHGVYVRGTLRGHIPIAQGILRNIAPGIA